MLKRAGGVRQNTETISEETVNKVKCLIAAAVERPQIPNAENSWGFALHKYYSPLWFKKVRDEGNTYATHVSCLTFPFNCVEYCLSVCYPK